MALINKRLVSVDKPFIQKHLSDFLALDALCFGEDAWNAEAFLSDLPEKFETSLSVWSDEQLCGFAMVSRKPEWLHIHRYAVHPDRQGQGLGKVMLQELQRAHPHDIIGLKVAMKNLEAIYFYLSKGFVFIAQSNGYYTLLLYP